jgi:cell division septal protein FtsQ
MTRGSSSGNEPPRLRYWRNRGNRKVRKARIARNLLQLSSVVVLNLLLAAALLFAGLQAVKHLSGSGEFSVERIELVGVNRASSEELRTALEPWIGRSLIEMDLERIDELLRRDPWVLRTSVKRALPATLRITVTEREPAAMALIDGRVYLVDGGGFVIGPVGKDMSDDLPVLTGLDNLDGAGKAAALARGAGLLARLRERATEFTSGISEMDLSSNAKITVRTVDRGPRIFLDPDLIERNVLKYMEMRPQIERGAGIMKYVDLRWSGRISVMPAVQTAQGEGR